MAMSQNRCSPHYKLSYTTKRYKVLRKPSYKEAKEIPHNKNHTTKNTQVHNKHHNLTAEHEHIEETNARDGARVSVVGG